MMYCFRGGTMSRLEFFYFQDYEDGKMARMQTTGEYEIPVNIFIDNASELEAAKPGYCNIDVCSVGSSIDIYASEEEYRQTDSNMDIMSMIPIGTFSAKPDDEAFQESPHILFTGKVLDVVLNPDAEEDEANCCILVETLGLTINIYLNYDRPVEKGYIVHGIAWLSVIWRWKKPEGNDYS